MSVPASLHGYWEEDVAGVMRRRKGLSIFKTLMGKGFSFFLFIYV